MRLSLGPQLFLATMLISPLAGATVIEEASWATFFETAGVEGTIVLWDPADERYRVHHRERAETAFIPASTFKIPHTLIALENGIVDNETSPLPWDGIERSISSWNRDQTLQSAVRYSVVPVFQEFARQIGPTQMQAWIERLDYGNRDISGEIDRFWLDGELRISALEQIGFLHRLQALTLPASERSQRIVRSVLLHEAHDGVVMYGKTGYANAGDHAIGWWVGWVEQENSVTFFASNLQLESIAQAPLRQSLTRAILIEAGILPSSWATR